MHQCKVRFSYFSVISLVFSSPDLILTVILSQSTFAQSITVEGSITQSWSGQIDSIALDLL